MSLFPYIIANKIAQIHCGTISLLLFRRFYLRSQLFPGVCLGLSHRVLPATPECLFRVIQTGLPAHLGNWES